MRPEPNFRIESHRIEKSPGDPRNECRNTNIGMFQFRRNNSDLIVQSSVGGGWEHVSVHAKENGRNRCPTWDEMAWIKDRFWRDDETVMQLHVPGDDHVNLHTTTLHLWRPINHLIPRPPKEFV